MRVEAPQLRAPSASRTSVLTLQKDKQPHPAGERRAGPHTSLAFPTPGKERRKRGGGAERLSLLGASGVESSVARFT